MKDETVPDYTHMHSLQMVDYTRLLVTAMFEYILMAYFSQGRLHRQADMPAWPRRRN